MPPIERIPAPGDAVTYLPSPKAPRGPATNLHVENPRQPMRAKITRVHTARLVDLEVTDHNGNTHRVPLVPFLHRGDPDPQSPCGRCMWPDEVLRARSEDEVDIDPGDPDGEGG